jgi:hypothetical protein
MRRSTQRHRRPVLGVSGDADDKAPNRNNVLAGKDNALLKP